MRFRLAAILPWPSCGDIVGARKRRLGMTRKPLTDARETLDLKFSVNSRMLYH